ncbi:MAG: long-chain-fatty-acid--CoA ligase [Brevirhabdus sp.]
MQGMMMDRPLRVIDLLAYGAEVYGDVPIVSRRVEGDIHRTNYRETFARVAQAAYGLKSLGLGNGDRVATLAWNGYRHLECYFAVAGIGAVCHTINPRLSAEQMIYIANHADDRVMVFDLTFLPLIEKLADQFPKGMQFVALAGREDIPKSALDLICYEDLLDGQPTTFDWPEFDENSACSLCYTSGTTGNPKGALYSHRSTVLHALFACTAFQKCLNMHSTVLPVVPLFHVNAWGVPYAAPITGTSIVFPGPNLDGASLWELMDAEKVYSSWGVPTVWLGLMEEIKKRGRPPEGLGDIVIGGSAAPRAMIEGFEKMGVGVTHAWGMTEMSPIGTLGNLSPSMENLPLQERLDIKQKQGRRMFGVEMKIVAEDGTVQPHDGQSIGELYVRGPSIVKGYFQNAEATAEALDADGWFGTGDVASIDEQGFLCISDRAKDLIKSGGEWISSLDVENVVMSHPAVANCAVVGIPHPKWDERPLLVVVPDGPAPSSDDVLEHLRPHLAKWQMPDDVVFVDALPLTATGKVSKLTLRQQFADYVVGDG